jgi:hypothetical protein
MSELLFGTQTFENIVRDTFVGEAIVPHLDLVRAALLGDSTLAGNRQIMTILNPGFHNSTPPSPPIPIVSAVLHKPLPVHSPIPFPHTINKITIEAPPVPQSPSLQAPPVPTPAAAAFAATAPVPTTPATAAASGGKLVSLWGFF